MGAKITMCITTVCGSLIVPMGVGQDGIVLPLDNACQKSDECASVSIILARDDSSMPKYMTIYRPLSDFITSDNAVSARVKVGGKVCVENNSNWTYEFGRQYMLRGYDSLEIDLMLDNGKIIRMRKRRPKVLHEDGSSIKVKPCRKWESLVSFDRRLWDFSSEIGTNKITRLRPRFAFGAYNVDGIYYRTTDEVRKRTKIDRHFDDRGGELVGDWVGCTCTDVLSFAAGGANTDEVTLASAGADSILGTEDDIMGHLSSNSLSSEIKSSIGNWSAGILCCDH